MADTAELELEEALSTLRDIRAVRYLAGTSCARAPLPK